MKEDKLEFECATHNTHVHEELGTCRNTNIHRSYTFKQTHTLLMCMCTQRTITQKHTQFKANGDTYIYIQYIQTYTCIQKADAFTHKHTHPGE